MHFPLRIKSDVASETESPKYVRNPSERASNERDTRSAKYNLYSVRIIFVGSVQPYVIKVLMESFSVAIPKVLSLVSSKTDIANLTSIGFPSSLMYRVGYDGFGCDHERAKRAYKVHRQPILNRLKVQSPVELTIIVTFAGGGTVGILENLITDLLSLEPTTPILVFVKVAAAPYSSSVHVSNSINVLKTLKKLMENHPEKVSAILISDGSQLDELSANEILGELCAVTLGALTVSSTPAANLGRELTKSMKLETPDSAFQWFIIPAIISCDENDFEIAITKIEGTIESALSLTLSSTSCGIKYSIKPPCSAWGLLLYPKGIELNESELNEIRSRITSLTIESLEKLSGDRGLCSIEAVQTGNAWELYLLIRGARVEAVNGVPVDWGET